MAHKKEGKERISDPKVLHFTKDADGTVTVKAIARSNSPKSSLTEVIQHQAKKQKSISKGNL